MIFWDFPRASWQYDVVVGLILVFVFATPREWFHDQPSGSNVVLLSANHGVNRVFLAPDVMASLPEGQWAERAQRSIKEKTGKNWHVVRVEPIRDGAASEIKGFIAYTAP